MPQQLKHILIAIGCILVVIFYCWIAWDISIALGWYA